METFGDHQENGNNDVHWLKVTVDARSREVFSYQTQIVPGNRTAVPSAVSSGRNPGSETVPRMSLKRRHAWDPYFGRPGVDRAGVDQRGESRSFANWKREQSGP